LREAQIVRILLANRNCDIFCLHLDKWSWEVINWAGVSHKLKVNITIMPFI